MGPMTVAAELDVRPLSPLIGAEIAGVDLSEPLGAEVAAAVRAALNRHHVIFFRDQDLTPAQQADFARQFGEVTEGHPVLPAIARAIPRCWPSTAGRTGPTGGTPT